MMLINNLNILYEDNHIIVVVKPKDILSQKDSTNDIDILTIVKEYLKEKYQKPGNVYLGLVHRLDRRVGGVMVLAKTSKGAARLSESIKSGAFKKKYLAICLGLVESDTLINNLEKVDKVSKDSSEGKLAILNYRLIKKISIDDTDFSLVEVELLTGRYNQIRSQFSLINHPLLGDYKYGYRGKNYFDDIGLFSYYLSFPHPITKEIMEFTYLPDCGIWKMVEVKNK